MKKNDGEYSEYEATITITKTIDKDLMHKIVDCHVLFMQFISEFAAGTDEYVAKTDSIKKKKEKTS